MECAPRLLLALLPLLPLLCFPGCAAPAAAHAPAPPLREEGPSIVRVFPVGDITRPICDPFWLHGDGSGYCVFYFEFPPEVIPDTYAAEPEVLLALLRSWTGVGSGGPDGPLLEMQGTANLFAVGPSRLMDEIESVLRSLREGGRPRGSFEKDGARGGEGAEASGSEDDH